ncbi:trypco2 family protein [Actinoallomurus rhizosphaericola]|uniref:trypco2 family protein n=1 Tax=Actinoallomurus rhizosphaericola TaxID=2952536 RepID=UPI002091A6D4|nr:trypco2 family protein [Actinoallomurus rhizosphaericola]MCO5993911.1 hypothetical protein [Actinoallomurus rhizosphaericola]
MEIELAQLLTALRSEIDRARISALDQDVRFRINSIDLELQVAVEKSAEANAGVKFWVISIGGKAAAKSVGTHIVRLSLNAETASGEQVLTGDDISNLVSEG